MGVRNMFLIRTTMFLALHWDCLGLVENLSWKIFRLKLGYLFNIFHFKLIIHWKFTLKGDCIIQYFRKYHEICSKLIFFRNSFSSPSFATSLKKTYVVTLVPSKSVATWWSPNELNGNQWFYLFILHSVKEADLTTVLANL